MRTIPKLRNVGRGSSDDASPAPRLDYRLGLISAEQGFEAAGVTIDMEHQEARRDFVHAIRLLASDKEWNHLEACALFAHRLIVWRRSETAGCVEHFW
jgi:hypothetical protein